MNLRRLCIHVRDPDLMRQSRLPVKRTDRGRNGTSHISKPARFPTLRHFDDGIAGSKARVDHPNMKPIVVGLQLLVAPVL